MTGVIGEADNTARSLEYVKNDIGFESGDLADHGAQDIEVLCKKCQPRKNVRVRIIPENNSHDVDWATALSNRERRGYIVAKLINRSSADTLVDLNLAPNEIAYRWIGPTDPRDKKKHRIAWVKLNAATGAREGDFMDETNNVKYCDVDGWESRTRPKIRKADDVEDHKDCVIAKVNFYVDGRVLVDPIREMTIPPGMWSSCAGGCCQELN